jgi:hypothetical protein
MQPAAGVPVQAASTNEVPLDTIWPATAPQLGDALVHAAESMRVSVARLGATRVVE